MLYTRFDNNSDEIAPQHQILYPQNQQNKDIVHLLSRFETPILPSFALPDTLIKLDFSCDINDIVNAELARKVKKNLFPSNNFKQCLINKLRSHAQLLEAEDNEIARKCWGFIIKFIEGDLKLKKITAIDQLCTQLSNDSNTNSIEQTISEVRKNPDFQIIDKKTLLFFSKSRTSCILEQSIQTERAYQLSV